MAKALRKTLPKNFDELLEKGASLETLQALLEPCDPNATGGYSKRTALAFYNCPDELVHWLLARGADINARDQYKDTALHERASSWKGGVELLLELGADINARDNKGNTPLHAAAGSAKSQSARALIARGADVHAQNQEWQTPLMKALTEPSSARLIELAELVDVLLAAGAVIDDDMRAEVRRIGEQFEFHRERFNPERLDDSDAALRRLYQWFAVTPVAARRVHDGKSPITVTATDWPDQHEELWALLVPSSGAAKTMQGEAIRVPGRIGREILDNGGVNWDADFRAMLQALDQYFASGTPLPPAELAEAMALTAALRSGDADAEPVHRLMALGVRWVLANPTPIALQTPGYKR